MRELEGVVHERDAMAARLSMLEARLDETRSERGQVGWVARVGLLCKAASVGAASVGLPLCCLLLAVARHMCVDAQPWLPPEPCTSLRCHGPSVCFLC